MKSFDEVNETMLHRCVMRIRPRTAPGIDGITRDEFRCSNGCSILARELHEGTYRPQPARRGWLPKHDGSLRPIAIPTIRDRVVQRAVAAHLSNHYDGSFSEASFGFRPKRNANQAVRRVMRSIATMRAPVVVEFDIVKCFDRLRHEDILGRLVADGIDPRVIQLVEQFLTVRVESEHAASSVVGVPQGGPLSPMMANLVLDRALDEWFPRAAAADGWGDTTLARYADDFVAVVEGATVSNRVRRAVGERLSQFGLDVHPKKTGTVVMRPSLPGRPGGRFDFLGWRIGFEEHAHGRRLVRRTSYKTMRRSLQRAARSMRGRRWAAKTPSERLDWFHAVRRGHRAYFGIPDNEPQVRHFEAEFERLFDRAVRRARPVGAAVPYHGTSRANPCARTTG
ncbi:MAG: reverse transcriptase domain-containing protein [Myxococcales bacterium]|nr:reverse transcriptase domain-containing protein [Myxococcales bacterium]